MNLIVCITGDIDYFNIETIDCLDKYFLILNKYDIKAELFITGKAAENFPERVEYIIKHHHFIGGHGDVHEAFYGSEAIQTERLKDMIKIFADYFDLAIEGFRAPWYMHNNNTFQAIENAGLKYDCSKKRFEIAFKRIPFFQTRYMYTKAYPYAKPLLKCVGNLYNKIHNSPQIPYKISSNVLEIPTLGISDYSLIGDPSGPQFLPRDSIKIANIWIECLIALKQRGGGVMTIQAHPGRLSPAFMESLDMFIEKAISIGAVFSTPYEINYQFRCGVYTEKDLADMTGSRDVE